MDAYADDTTFVSSSHHNDILQMQSNLQNDMNNLHSWSENNRMILNATKTKSMLTQSSKPLKANAYAELNTTKGKCSHRAQLHWRQMLTQSLTQLKANAYTGLKAT